MTGIIVAAHGTLASAAVEAAGMFLGEQEKVECIAFQPGDSLETLLERFQQAAGRLGGEDGLLILTDLQGGSPCNVATLLQKTMEGVRTVYGFSVPMLLEVLEARDRSPALDDLVSAALRTGREAMGSIALD